MVKMMELCNKMLFFPFLFHIYSTVSLLIYIVCVMWSSTISTSLLSHSRHVSAASAILSTSCIHSLDKKLSLSSTSGPHGIDFIIQRRGHNQTLKHHGFILLHSTMDLEQKNKTQCNTTSFKSLLNWLSHSFFYQHAIHFCWH